MNEIDSALFDALCDVVIYHFCDVCRIAGSEDSSSAELLVQRGIMENTSDSEAAYAEYERLVCEYGLAALPGFSRRHDYWGAVCVTDIDTFNAPRLDRQGGRVFFAGDSCGRVIFFDNTEALKQYTEECAADLQAVATERGATGDWS